MSHREHLAALRAEHEQTLALAAEHDARRDFATAAQLRRQAVNIGTRASLYERANAAALGAEDRAAAEARRVADDAADAARRAALPPGSELAEYERRRADGDQIGAEVYRRAHVFAIDRQQRARDAAPDEPPPRAA